LCTWNNHYCWPGNCSANGLTQSCSCAPGFAKVSISGPSIDSGNTTCQPTQRLTLLTCDTKAVGPNGERHCAMSVTASTACENLQDMYGNFQPSLVVFRMASEFNIGIENVTKPAFIFESKFGITDTLVRIERKDLKGKHFICQRNFK